MTIYVVSKKIAIQLGVSTDWYSHMSSQLCLRTNIAEMLHENEGVWKLQFTINKYLTPLCTTYLYFWLRRHKGDT